MAKSTVHAGPLTAEEIAAAAEADSVKVTVEGNFDDPDTTVADLVTQSAAKRKNRKTGG